MSNTRDGANFANIILVPSGTSQSPMLLTTRAQEPQRKKRPHYKSRRGCIECKRRRVKCDERLPCSSCARRKVQCIQPFHQPAIPPSPCRRGFQLGVQVDSDPQITLLHLELFHHWDRKTQPTLAFTQIWPIVTQLAFSRDFLMSAILCISAMHLSALCPHVVNYSRTANQLMAKTIRLFRENLTCPLTKDNCEAFIGTSLLVNYILWFDISFLETLATTEGSPPQARFGIALDQLFLHSSGILQVWFQAIPILIDEGSVFTSMVHQNPRIDIEKVLLERGEDPSRFVAPFMAIWDDPRYQTSDNIFADKNGYTSYAWRFLVGLEKELPCSTSLVSFNGTCTSEIGNEKKKLAHLRDAFSKLTTKYARSEDGGSPATVSSPTELPRSSFEGIIRRLSPLLCCAASKLSSNGTGRSNAIPKEADIEQLFYGFPNLCCGPFMDLIVVGDSRALVFLFHFYRASRILLDSERCWWAYRRSLAFEHLIMEELKSRELYICFL